ncbi:MAG: MFS transporter [Actinobacteria bacterium]|nr:MFS transporter [Actinomycetota bacterium]
MGENTSIYRNPNLLISFGVTLMGIMGVSLIAPTLPNMANALHIPKESVGLVITAFTLPGAVLAIFAGVLADKYGRKRVLIPSLILFAISGVAAFFVDRFSDLIFLRVLQGLGATALVSLGTVLIGDTFTGINRARAMGANASILSLGTGLFPFFGGALALLSWNYPYLLFLLAIPIALITWLYIKEPELEKDTKMLEYLSSALAYMKTPRALSTFTAGIVTFIVLYGAVLTYFGILLADLFYVKPFIIGVFLGIMSLTTAAFSTLAGRLAAKTSKRNIIGTGFLLYGIGLIIVPLIKSVWLFLVPMVIFGIGHGLNVPALQTITAELAPTQYRGAMVSLFGIMIRAGMTIGPALLGLVYSLVGDKLLGLHAVFYASAVLAITTGFVGMILPIKSREPVTRRTY